MDNTQTSQQGPSGLDAYISQAESRPANIDDMLAVNERDAEVRQGENGGGTVNVGLEAGNADAARLTNQQVGVGSQDDSAIRIAEAERRAAEAEAAARRAAADRVEAQNREFEAAIAHLPDEDQQWYRLQRELQQTRQVNSWLGQKMVSQQTAQQQTVQENAKRITALTIAQQSGLPQNPVIHEMLMTSRNLDEMRAKAAQVASLVGANRAANVRGTQRAGGFAAGGQVGQSAPAARPKPYSGDLGGLIRSRSYQFVQQ